MRESNITLKQLGILEQHNRDVAVITHDNSFLCNGMAEIWLTKEAMDNRYENGAEYVVAKLLHIVDYVIQNECEGLSINGLAPNEIYISRADLLPLKEDIDSLCVITAYLNNKIPEEKFAELIKHKQVYFIGDFPEAGKKTFGVCTLKHKSGKYEMIPVYLIEEHAQKSKFLKDRPLTKILLSELSFMYNGIYGIIIEPEEKYWVEILPEKMDLYKRN